MVSVVVPIYNTEKYLNRCLESIKNQDCKNIQVIMIDDGSTDGSNVIAQNFVSTDDRFILISQKNAGVSAARNKGLKKATGEYLLFVDSDDWIEPDMISTLVENILETGADVSCCQYDKMVRSDIGALEKWEQRQALETFIIHQKINGSLVNKLIKREILDGLEFDSSIRYGEDALFCWEVLLRAKSFCITNRVLYHVVMHSDSASGGGSYKPIRKDCIRVWEGVCKDAEQIGEPYSDMAKAQLGNMAFYSLYTMAVFKYHEREEEKYFQQVLRGILGAMKYAAFIPSSEKVMAIIYSFSIGLGNFLVEVRRKVKG